MGIDGMPSVCSLQWLGGNNGTGIPTQMGTADPTEAGRREGREQTITASEGRGYAGDWVIRDWYCY